MTTLHNENQKFYNEQVNKVNETKKSEDFTFKNLEKLQEKHPQYTHTQCHMTNILTLLIDHEAQAFKRITEATARDILHVVSAEDIQQGIIEKVMQNPYQFDDFNYFYKRIKYYAINEVRKTVRHHRKFQAKKAQIVREASAGGEAGENVIRSGNKKIRIASQEHRHEIRLDIADLLTADENKLFNLIYRQGLTQLEAKEVMGKRIDRTLQSIKAKVKAYHEEAIQ